MGLVLELLGSEKPERGVPTATVAEDLDVPEELGA
jgi:hypothetical protein